MGPVLPVGPVDPVGPAEGPVGPVAPEGGVQLDQTGGGPLESKTRL